MQREAQDTPILAAAEHGFVVLDGPDGLATTLTPEAAKRSAKHIHAAAKIAAREPDTEMP